MCMKPSVTAVPSDGPRDIRTGAFGTSLLPPVHGDAIDLCDALSSFSSQGKATLHEISRVMGLPGKPKGFDGGEVELYFREGEIKYLADYCETDVVGTYQVWLRYELF